MLLPDLSDLNLVDSLVNMPPFVSWKSTTKPTQFNFWPIERLITSSTGRDSDYQRMRQSHTTGAHFATDRGYAVLAIDRLGSGTSRHPDPLLEVQASLEAEILHQIVLQLRNGELGKKFSKVAYIGHSRGSLFGIRATQLHPQDFDAVILTGWSANFVENFSKILVGVFLPAALELRNRFAALHPLYLVLTIQQFVRQALYGPDGTFDPAIEQ
ncbi:hypothetical protein FQN53_006046 [Emmonsiellopsis sp. PD_33]|nr:hypothetical protein FQN53_006046 [Emmonsiellopsis sp. PD_33]